MRDLAKNMENIFFSWQDGSIKIKRGKLIIKILVNWTWMSLAIILCAAGPGAYVGIPVFIVAFFFFRVYANVWKNQGYSLLLLYAVTILILGLVAMLTKPIFHFIDYIFMYWHN